MSDTKERIKKKLATKQRLNRREQQKYTAMCRSAKGAEQAHMKVPANAVVVTTPDAGAVLLSPLAADIREERERKENLKFIEEQGWKLMNGRWRTQKGHFVKKADLVKAGLVDFPPA